MEPQEPKTEKPLSNRERAAIKDELITELVTGCQNEGDLFGPEGVFTRLKGAVMQRLLEAEMTTHLGHEPNDHWDDRAGQRRRDDARPRAARGGAAERCRARELRRAGDDDDPADAPFVGLRLPPR